MAKQALLVGINYPDSEYPLRGCVNDVETMRGVLIDVFDFPPANIKTLTNDEATTSAMLLNLEALVAGAVPGDILYFHYSGHGSQLPDGPDDDYELDGLDEVLCPIDLNWEDKIIRDDDLKRIFDKVASGVNLTVVLDCCNSGDGMDHTGSYTPAYRGDVDGLEGRFITPPPEFMKKPKIGFKPRMVSRNINTTSLLVSACQEDQLSIDARFGLTWMGACTYHLAKILREYPNITYLALIEKLTSRLASDDFTQRPELNGPGRLHRSKFLTSFAEAAFEVDEEPAAPYYHIEEEELSWFQRIIEWFKNLFR